MPQKGYSVLKVKPLDNKWEIQKQKLRVLHVLEFEVAERLLLGARFRQLEVNPLDYIHSALGAKIRPLDPGRHHQQLSGCCHMINDGSLLITHHIRIQSRRSASVKFHPSLHLQQCRKGHCSRVHLCCFSRSGQRQGGLV